MQEINLYLNFVLVFIEICKAYKSFVKDDEENKNNKSN